MYVKCLAQKKKGRRIRCGVCRYLAEGVGKFTEEAVSVCALCLLTGTENMKSGDYTAAFSYFQKAAARGYSKAQYNAGLCHEHGRGTPRDISKVFPFPQARPLCWAAEIDV